MVAGLGVWYCQAAFPYWWTACGPAIYRARRERLLVGDELAVVVGIDSADGDSATVTAIIDRDGATTVRYLPEGRPQ